MQVLVDNAKVEIEEGASAFALCQKLGLSAPDQALAVSINGQLTDLTETLFENDQVHFLSFEESEGQKIFWHSSAHVLAQAVTRLWPEAEPTIGPAIEKGFYYDFAGLNISDKDFPLIEEEIKKIIAENYKPEKIIFQDSQEALKTFKNNKYKKELIEEYKKDRLTAYRQGEFIDLCRGPHLSSLSKIKAFKILKISGAYWRADPQKEMLTRIYGISFPDRKQLADYLKMLEEAQKRDHKKLGQELDLFSLKEEAPGMPFIHTKGVFIWNQLIDFMRDCLKDTYVEIKTPIMLSKELWELSGHWSHYKENMYTSAVEEREYAIKPMNCPGGMLFYKSHLHSYRELPLRVAEVGLVHRHEASGALSGLFRVRA
ncbi:MAG: threonine--tRNA ligase, partial [Parachlamydiales bacterium]